MAMFKVLWASANLYPLISKQTKVKNLSLNFYIHLKTCDFPNVSNTSILWCWGGQKVSLSSMRCFLLSYY